MPTLVSDCPRCGVKKHTFDVRGAIYFRDNDTGNILSEVFCQCRSCFLGTVFLVIDKPSYSEVNNQEITRYNGNLNDICVVDRYISIIDFHTINAPRHLPQSVEKAFSEAAKAYSVGCWNAAACMFRSSIDIATRGFLPEGNVDGLDDNTRRFLARRLKWLFKSGVLQKDLEGLASCVKEDGNEAAHSTTLEEEDAADLLEFTVALLERIYTEPQKIQLAERRRKERRAKADGAKKG